MSKPSARQRRYWDSATFVALLKPELDRQVQCEAVVKAAKAGTVVIVTSALTLAEVVKLRHFPPLTRAESGQLTAFFQHSWIVVRQVSRGLAEQARELVWDHNVDPKDAIHVATALAADVVQFDTFDGDLIKKSGTLGGQPPLVIGRPNVPEQLPLPAADDVTIP